MVINVSIAETIYDETLSDLDLEAFLSENPVPDHLETEPGDDIEWGEPVQSFLDQASELPTLDVDVQRKLGLLIRSAVLEEAVCDESDRETYSQARQRAETLLVINSQGLVKYAVGKLAVHAGFDREALIQAGNEGLCRAARKFDPDKGAFSSIAYLEIINTAQRHLAEVEYAISVPLIALRQLKILIGLRANFHWKHGRDPSEDEWVTVYNSSLVTSSGEVKEREQQRMSVGKLRHLLAATRTKQDQAAERVSAGDSEPEMYVLAQELRGKLTSAYERALADMAPRQRRVFEMRLPDEDDNLATYIEIGQKLGITPQAARKLDVKAKRRLRTELALVDPKYAAYRLNMNREASKPAGPEVDSDAEPDQGEESALGLEAPAEGETDAAEKPPKIGTAERRNIAARLQLRAYGPAAAAAVLAVLDTPNKTFRLDGGNCVAADPDELFVEGDKEQKEAAARICGGCALRAECIGHALASGTDYGVWGGATEKERRLILRAIPDIRQWARDSLAVS